MAKQQQDWTPETLMETMRGFQPACVIGAALDLDVFGKLADGGKTAQQTARALKGAVRGTEQLLNALTALGLLTKRGDTFSLTPFSEKFLTPQSPHFLGWGAMHAAHLMNAWNHIAETVRTGKPAPRPPHDSEAGKTRHKNFIMAMHNYSLKRSGMIVGALNLKGVKTVLDVGGGPGTYAFAFADALPHAHITIFDSPPTCAIASENIKQRGLQDRISTSPGDFNTDDLGAGYDLILMSSILHIYSPAENKKLLKKGFRALNPGGRLVVLEIEVDDSGAKPPGGAMFAINMLVNTERGSSYSANEMKPWLTAAGFKTVKVSKPTEGIVALVAAKPK
jgi:ubiquinone/menaquinone biosynthesis C-methylase UbiE